MAPEVKRFVHLSESPCFDLLLLQSAISCVLVPETESENESCLVCHLCVFVFNEHDVPDISV